MAVRRGAVVMVGMFMLLTGCAVLGPMPLPVLAPPPPPPLPSFPTASGSGYATPAAMNGSGYAYATAISSGGTHPTPEIRVRTMVGLPVAASHSVSAARPTTAQARLCAVLGEPAEPADCDRAQQVQGKLESGWGSFKPLGPLVEQKKYTLNFYLDASRAEISRRTASPLGNAEIRSLRMTDWMRVTLMPHPDFKIAPIGESDRLLTQDKDQQWQWHVIPQRADEQPFELIAVVVPLAVTDDGRKLPLRSAQRQASIQVDVDQWLAVDRGIERATGLSIRLKALFEGWNAVFIALGVLLATILGFWRKLPFGKRNDRAAADAAQPTAPQTAG